LIPQYAQKFQQKIRGGEWPAMLNYLKKFTMDILPSVAATIIGAYIVNHYIVARPAAPPAAAEATVDPKAATADTKPAEKAAEASSLPEAGVKAKGMSERTLLERATAEKAAVVEKPQDKSQDKSADAKSADAKSADAKSVDAKPAEAPSETASLPADSRRHQAAPREKTTVRVVLPSPVQAAVPAVTNPSPAAPAVAAPAPTVEAAVAPEERRDANDLARAAIERLRGGDNPQRSQEAAHAPEAARIPEAPRVVMAPAVRPLPPPVMVSAPPSEAIDQGISQPKPPYAADARIDDPRRPVPPADIPISRPPLDLHAEASVPAAKEHTTVADDMLSAAKSVFHAVLPK
jgi:hypothetical protein